MGTLSGGTKAKGSVQPWLFPFQKSPEILILDEPNCWSGIQSLSRFLKAKIKKESPAGKLISHYLSHILNDLEEAYGIMPIYFFEGWKCFSMIPLTSLKEIDW